MESLNDSQARRMYVIYVANESSGICNLKNIDLKNESAEFDIYLKPGDSGKGIGYAGMAALMHIAFEGLRLNRLYAYYFENNERAGKMYKKIGFESEGLLRECVKTDNSFSSSVAISMLQREWASLKQSILEQSQYEILPAEEYKYTL